MISICIINVKICLKIFSLFLSKFVFFLKFMKIITVLKKMNQRKRNKKRKYRTKRGPRAAFTKGSFSQMTVWIFHPIQVFQVFCSLKYPTTNFYLSRHLRENFLLFLFSGNLLFHTCWEISQPTFTVGGPCWCQGHKLCLIIESVLPNAGTIASVLYFAQDLFLSNKSSVFLLCTGIFW